MNPSVYLVIKKFFNFKFKIFSVNLIKSTVIYYIDIIYVVRKK